MFGQRISDQSLARSLDEYTQNLIDKSIEQENSFTNNDDHNENKYNNNTRDEDEYDFVNMDSPRSSTSSSKRRRRDSDSDTIPEFFTPGAAAEFKSSNNTSSLPRGATIAQVMRERAQHFSNEGIFSGPGGPGGPLGGGNINQPIPDKDLICGQVVYDPFKEDFRECIEQDKAAGMDMSYCFLCDRTLSEAERQKNGHYKALLTIWYENYGKLLLITLTRKIRRSYEMHIRSKKPDLYKMWALIQIRNHFLIHIDSAEVFHVESVKTMKKVLNIVTTKGLFTYDPSNPSDENVDVDKLKIYMKVHDKLEKMYATLPTKRSRLSHALI